MNNNIKKLTISFKYDHNVGIYTFFFQKVNTYKDDFKIFCSPFSNCQMYSISKAKNLIFLTSAQLTFVFSAVYENVRKRMFTVDLNRDKVNLFLNNIQPFLDTTTLPKKLNYTSTNGSKMTILICKLNIDVIDAKKKELIKNKIWAAITNTNG
jgi:hypothetical protein